MTDGLAPRPPRKPASPSGRSRGRELALKYLYQVDVRKGVDVEPFDAFAIHQEETGSAVAFARDIVTGVLQGRDAIDARLKALAKNWTLERMAVLDRNILRIGAWELADPAMPPAIAINEAVELAKRFSTLQSGKFVNGILDRLRPRGLAISPAADKTPEN